MSRKTIFIILFIFAIILVSAADQIPQGSMNFKDVYSIYNAVDINATVFRSGEGCIYSNATGLVLEGSCSV